MEKITLHNYEAFLLDFSEDKLSPLETNELLAFLALHPELEIDLNDLSFPSLEENNVRADFKDSLMRSSSFISDEEMINYLEGNMTPSQKQDIEIALLANPELEIELKRFQQTVLIADKTLIYSNKFKLLKIDELDLVQSPAIAYLENDLSPTERLEFEITLRDNLETKKEFELFKNTILVPDFSVVYENKSSLKKQPKVFFLLDKRFHASMAAAILLILGLIFVFSALINTKIDQAPLSSNTKANEKLALKDLLNTNKPDLKESDTSLPENKAINNEKNSETKWKAGINNTAINSEIADIKQTPQDSTFNQVAIVSSSTEIMSNVNKTAQEQEANKDVLIASVDKSDLIKLTSLEEVEDEEEMIAENNSKNAFWKKAVKVAQRVNNLGLKAINGAESNNNQYLLSFNSFSIEKK